MTFFIDLAKKHYSELPYKNGSHSKWKPLPALLGDELPRFQSHFFQVPERGKSWLNSYVLQ